MNLRTKQEAGSGNCSADAVEIVPKMSACNVGKCVTRYLVNSLFYFYLLLFNTLLCNFQYIYIRFSYTQT